MEDGQVPDFSAMFFVFVSVEFESQLMFRTVGKSNTKADSLATNATFISRQDSEAKVANLNCSNNVLVTHPL